MPNIKSAKKRVKVIAAKTLRNKAIKSELKTYVKKAQNAEENKANDKILTLQGDDAHRLRFFHDDVAQHFGPLSGKVAPHG